MTITTAALFVLGGILELFALELARHDLRDAEAAAKQREKQIPSMMAAGKHAMHGWITQATRTRTQGIWLFAAGVVVQTLGNLLTLF